MSFLKKNYIPEIFKTKKFIIFVSILILIFLFTPISLHQIGKKAEGFINSKVIEGVKQFEKQTGLQIEWDSLEFNIFLITVTLEGVSVFHNKEFSEKKIEEFRFLNGLQKIKKISARPSLYSFLFKKEIILSKLKIESGDIFLQTLKTTKKNENVSKNIQLPIKKIFIKNTNITLQHREYFLRFSNIKSQIFQKSGRLFDFSLIVQSFYFDKYLGFEDFLNVKSTQIEKEKKYQLFVEGTVTKNQASFSQIVLKNNFFSSSTKNLELNFDTKGLKQLKVSSSGSLPFSLLQEAFSFVNKNFQFEGSNLYYDLDLTYNKNKGFKGFFNLLSENLMFRSEKLKSIELKGSLNNQFLFINKGSIRTENRGDVYIKSIEWGVLEKTFPFSFSLELDHLSSDFIAYTILELSEFTARGDLTGLLSCKGSGKSFDFLNCQFKGNSNKIKVQNNNQIDILSFSQFNLNVSLDWSDELLSFELTGDKTELSQMSLKGEYSQALNAFFADYSFIGELDTDLYFNTPFPLKGNVNFSVGKIAIQNSKIKVSTRLTSSDLNIDSYQLGNVSAFCRLKNSRLTFSNIKGRSGKSNYSAKILIDFNKEKLKAQLDSSFFDITDFLKAIKNKIKTPIDFKGSGAVSFFIDRSFKGNKKKFKLNGDFFNVFIGVDFFSQSTFDIVFDNKKGLVKSFILKKGQGLIASSGSFNENYNLNLKMNGQKLPLENIQVLNNILPFNQSGLVSFNSDIKGALKNPNLTGSVSISNAFFYSYPVKNSALKFKINKNSFSFLGNIIDEIKIDDFVYSFSKNPELKIKGSFNNLDFIKFLLSKNKKQQVENYSSQLAGFFNIKKISNSFWEGKVDFDKFLISKSNQWIENKDPFSIILDKKRWSLSSSVSFLDSYNKFIILEKTKPDQLLLRGSSSLGFFSVITPFFQDFEGDIKGQVFLNNNFKRLKPKGSLYFEKGLLAIPPLPSFTNVSAQLIFSKDNIIINSFKSGIGGGVVKGIGNIFYDFIQPPVLDLNLNFDRVHFQIPEGFNTKGNGKIKIKGSKAPYLISGEYSIDSGSIVREFASSSATDKRYDFSLLKEEKEKEKSIFELNLDIKTKQAVSINSSLIRSSLKGFATIYGAFNSLLMTGKFFLSKDLKNSLIFFRGQEFSINSGEISFNNSSPLNPYLNISANTIFKEKLINPTEGQEQIENQYKIFLSTKGYSQNLNFSLKSTPVLNEREIISLLTLGVSSQRFDSNVKQNITDYSYYPYQILTSLLIERSLNKEIKDTLGFDFRLTPYIDTLNKPVTKITLSKNWFEKWRTSFSRTIEESAYSDVRLKYDISDKISLTAFWENNNKEQFVQDVQEDSLTGVDFEFSFDF